MQSFARIDLAAAGVPDAPTLLKFRRLLATHDLCKCLFTAINADLTARGLLLRAGTLVDATLIAAPSSTRNEQKERDPEMHQTKKGNQWYFGMKAHLGAEQTAILAAEKIKASVWAYVEHPFPLVKNIFRHRKVRYRGRVKNGQQLYTLFGLANVGLAGRTAATA